MLSHFCLTDDSSSTLLGLHCHILRFLMCQMFSVGKKPLCRLASSATRLTVQPKPQRLICREPFMSTTQLVNKSLGVLQVDIVERVRASGFVLQKTTFCLNKITEWKKDELVYWKVIFRKREREGGRWMKQREILTGMSYSLSGHQHGNPHC